MRRMVASLLLPFTIDVTYRGASGANQFHLNSLGKPFWTGSVLSLKNLGNEQGRYRSSARNQSDAIFLRTADDSVFLERQGRSWTTVKMPLRDGHVGEQSKKEGILCLEDISYSWYPPAYC